MNFTMFRSLQGTISSLAKVILTPKALPVTGFKSIHQICNQHSSFLNPISVQNSLNATNNLSSILKPTSFLAPTQLPQFTQVCGLKIKGHLLLRCKGCYKVARGGLLYVMCKLKKKHKQVQMHKSWKKTRILTAVSQKKVCDWPRVLHK